MLSRLAFLAFSIGIAALVMANKEAGDWRKAIESLPLKEDNGSVSFAALLQTLRHKRLTLSHWPVDVWPKASVVDYEPSSEILALDVQSSDIDAFGGAFYAGLQRLVVSVPSTINRLNDLFEIAGASDAMLAALPSDSIEDEEGRQAVSQALSQVDMSSSRVVNWALVGGSHSSVPDRVYAIYNWRGRHDFVWITIDAKSERLLVADWYMALE